MEGYQPRVYCPKCEMSHPVVKTTKELKPEKDYYCCECQYGFNITNQKPPTSKTPQPKPEQDEIWWVKIGDDKVLYSRYIEKITDKIVILTSEDIPRHSICYEIGYVKFVEEK